MDVSAIAERLNDQAASLAAELLPNGHRSGNKWMASGIADTGRSASLYVHLSGPKIGHWADMGNAAPGEERGDMLDLLRLRLGLPDARAAIAEAKHRLGIADEWAGPRRGPNEAERARMAEEARARAEARDAAENAERALKAKRAKALYLSALGNEVPGSPVDHYLRNRGIDPGGAGRWPKALAYHPDVWCRPESLKVPTMLAAIYNAAGEQIGTHRTFLQNCAKRGWCKIDSPNAKMVLGNMWGGFVPINKGASGVPMARMPEGEPVYITEGIEDALCVRMLMPAARIVAAISLPNMGGIVLPATAKRVVLVCDRDEGARAQEALERSIAAQQARGLTVERVLPPVGIKDINDWVRALARGRAA